jgi:sulfate/thiosulfate transport system substrate-binding protein
MKIRFKGTRVLALAAVAALAIGATACGDDDDSGGAGSGPTTAAGSGTTAAGSETTVGSGTTAAGSESTAGSSASGSTVPAEASAGGDVSLVAYSTPQAAYASIIEAFKNTDAGKDVDVSESYGASGDQSRAVEAGQPADYVGFSLEPDISRLVKAGLVAEDWNDNATNGMVTNSVVVFMVRKGNPKNIQTWDDLTKDDVEVLNPNVFTSGGARWNVMAAYGSQIEQGKTEDEAVQYLNDLYANIPVQDASARESLQTFAGGVGDVLLGYENEAIFAQQQGEELDYVVPDQTILIENPVALTTSGAENPTAQAFYDYVFTPEAQEIFKANGYRPVSDEVDASEFPEPPGLFTIAEFDGWDAVMAKFFDPEGSIMVDVERGIGVAVEQ